MLKGTIMLESEVNKGTTVKVSIPLKQLPDKPFKEQIPQTTHFPVKSVLIVEDEQSNYEYLAELLAGTGIRLFYAPNGQKAIEICRNNTDIGLVLMDIKMPVMDGETATKEIKTFRPELPVIAQTAYALESDKEYFLKSGFTDYITKPIKSEVFFGAVNKYLGK